MSLLVDNPIVNSPFEEPTRYWDDKEGQPVLVEGHRPAGYHLKARTRGPQMELLEGGIRPTGAGHRHPGTGEGVAGARTYPNGPGRRTTGGTSLGWRLT